VNPGSAPGRVLRDHLEDQIPHFLGHLLPSDSPPHPGDQTPVQAEAGAMPADPGLGWGVTTNGGPEVGFEEIAIDLLQARFRDCAITVLEGAGSLPHLPTIRPQRTSIFV
jgi:hypothetical protein